MNEGQWTHRKHWHYPDRMPSTLILSLCFVSEQKQHLLTGNALRMLRHNQIIISSILHNNCFSQVNKCATLESLNYCQQGDVSVIKCNFKRNLNGAQHCPSGQKRKMACNYMRWKDYNSGAISVDRQNSFLKGTVVENMS